MDAFKNAIELTLVSGITADATEIQVLTGTAAVLDFLPCNVLLYDQLLGALKDTNREYIRLISKVGDTITIERPSLSNNYLGEGPENTAKAHNTLGRVYKIALVWSKKHIDDLISLINAIPVQRGPIAPIGTIGDDNRNFSIPVTSGYSFQTGSLEVFFQGRLLTVNSSYTISGTDFTMNTTNPPASNDAFFIKFRETKI
jgi:hypothetical protein